jgi:tetratricopeptide (TPR) repeat protein
MKEEYRNLMSIAPSIAHDERAATFSFYGQLDRALDEYYLALTFEPNDVDAYRGIAGVFVNENKLNRAIHEMRKAVAISEQVGDASIHADLADLLLAHNVTDEARSEYGKALTADPDNSHARLGIELTKLNEVNRHSLDRDAHSRIVAGIIDALKNIIQDDPQNVALLTVLGDV